MEILIPLALLFAFFWFFVMLPQRRRQREHAAMQETIRPGDEIITAGGMHGTVSAVEESIVELEIAPGTVVRVDLRAVAARVEPVDVLEPDAEHESVGTGSATEENPS